MPHYPHARARGFAPWAATTPSKLLIEQVLDVLEREREHWPMTARQVFYRMTVQHNYPKTDPASETLNNKINRARRCGMIPWEAIRDDGEAVRWLGPHNNHFDGPHDFHFTTKYRAANIKFHQNQVQPCVVEVHIEAAGMLPQVARICHPLGVWCYSSGGFGSVTTQYDAARRFAGRDRPTVVLSVGDFDASGLSVYWSWRENVIEFFANGTEYLGEDNVLTRGTNRLGLDYGMDQEPPLAPLFRRIAVTPEQIREHGFPAKPAKKTDKRGNWRGRTVQCEAIPPGLLAEIVEAAILEHYDKQGIDDVDALAAQHRTEMAKRYGGVRYRDIDTHVDERMDRIRDEVDDRFYDDDSDWTGGYTNEDEDEMEEGV